MPCAFSNPLNAKPLDANMTNVMSRGDMGDYDAWGALGNSGWSWQNMLPYFKKVSHMLAMHLDVVLLEGRELTLCANNRPKPSPRRTLRLLLRATSHGTTRSGATLVPCSTHTPTSSFRAVVSEPEHGMRVRGTGY